MATGPGVDQGKTKFVVEFLTEHGDARRVAINEAWRAAGHKGEISESLVSKLRAKHGLSGGRSVTGETEEIETSPEVTGKRASRKEEPKTVSEEEKPEVAVEEQAGSTAPGKAAFVEEILRRDPKATVKAVNEAWSEAGHEGTISDPTFYKVRGRLAAPSEPTGPTPAEPKSSKIPPVAEAKIKAPRTSATSTTKSKPSESSNSDKVADEVEAGIDDLMYKLKDSGGMPEVEAALRAARRLLYRSGEK